MRERWSLMTERQAMKQDISAKSVTVRTQLSAAIAVAKAFAQLHDGIVVPDYELLLSKDYRRFLGAGQIVLDVGAHAGLHLAQFVDLIGPSGRVIAFEPIPALANALAGKYRGRPNVDIRNVALADQPGRSEFLVLHKALGMSGFKQRTGSGDQGTQKITVETDTLDRQVGDLNRVDYIKMLHREVVWVFFNRFRSTVCC
jgi:FkbM family methyltransferase